MDEPIRILYVDDYPLDRQLVRDALEREHDVAADAAAAPRFRLTEAASREELEAALAAQPFDLVLSDFNILGFDGLQVLDVVRARCPQVPVVIVTGTGSEEVAVEAMKRGAADYVIKSPRHIRRLPVTIQGALARRRLEEERAAAQERVARQVQRLSALRAIDTALTATSDLDSSLQTLLAHLREQLQVDAAAVRLVDPTTDRLEWSTSVGFGSPEAATGAAELGRAHAERAAESRVLIAIPDLRQHGVPASDGAVPATADEPPGFVAYFGVPLIAKGHVKGVLELYHRRPLTPDEEWLGFLATVAAESAIAIDSAELVQTLQQLNADLLVAYDATIEGWSRALDLRDKETEGHTRRVTEMTLRLAVRMGIPAAQLEHVRRGALLHDIGKLGVPDHILLKPQPLDDEEWAIMRRHPQYAHDLLQQIEFLRPALDIPLCHHERWDGRGYPRGLRGEEIPLVARLFAVVDVWDALRSDRPYRAAWAPDRVLAHVRDLAGNHLDPRVVDEFLAFVAEEMPPRQSTP